MIAGIRRKWTLAQRLEAKQLMSEAQNHRCCYCGTTMCYEQGFSNSATFEHIVPLGLGGDDTYDNIVIACFACNNQRGNELELRLKNINRRVYFKREMNGLKKKPTSKRTSVMADLPYKWPTKAAEPSPNS